VEEQKCWCEVFFIISVFIIMEKICTECNKPKNIEEFSWKIKKQNTKHSKCKECKKKIDNKYYSSSKKRRSGIRKRSVESYEYLKKYVQRLKRFGKCKKCEDKRWYVLDFHHLRDKKDDISYLLRKGSIKKLKNEIKKCELLCSNCHRELHFLEREDQANQVKALV